MKAAILNPALEKLANAIAAVSVMEHSLPSDCPIGQPDYRRACRAITEDLETAYGQLTDIQDGVR